MNKKLFLLIVTTCLLMTSFVEAQVTIATNVAPAFGTQFVGWGSGTPKPLDIKNNFAAQDINFFTNLTGTSGSSVQRMVIKNTTGFVGINTPAPNQLLTLNAGNLNLQTATTGYMINNVMTMWRGSTGNITNIFVGANSGTANTSGLRNTFMGSNSGAANTSAPDNTFIGFNTGLNNTGNGRDNVFIGSMAGQSNTTGRQNTFVGYQAGFNNVTITPFTGEMNTFIGNTSGRLNRTGANNTFLGDQSGPNNRTGSNNVFLGRSAGKKNTTGSNNTIIGTGADVSDSVFTNACAIGAQAIVTGTNRMILGNNRVFVGIGMSGDTLLPPQNCLEIRAHPLGSVTPIPNASGLRFRQLTAASPAGPAATKYLTVDANGDVVLDTLITSGGTLTDANNGLSVNGTTVELGNKCGFTNAKLLSNREIPMNNFNLYFTGQSASPVPVTSNVIGLGYACGVVMPAKFNTLQAAPSPVGVSTIAGSFLNQDIANTTSLKFTGVKGEANGIQTVTKNTNVGGYFTASNSDDTRGIVAELLPSAQNTTTAIGAEINISAGSSTNVGISTFVTGTTSTGTNTGVSSNVSGARSNKGGQFISTAANTLGPNTGITGTAGSSSTVNVGGDFNVTVAASGASGANIAVRGNGGLLPAGSLLPANVVVGIYGSAENPNSSSLPGYAGYFDGNVFINGPLNGGAGYPLASDAQFKTNIDSIHNVKALLNQLKPRSFFFDTTNAFGLKFSNQKQYGFIAQDVETVMPELVASSTKPAMIDSSGNVVKAAVTYKTLNYNAFIAILMKGMQEQQSTIDSLQNNNNAQDSINNSLQSQLNTLAGMINSCCYNHQAQSAIPTSGTDVELQDSQSIVLDQNVPNPFAEQTTISYFLPETVVKAQMLFYNAQGKLIQSVELKEKGKGRLNVFAGDLSNGIYTYTLVVDGRIFETRKMLKQ